MRSLFTWIKQPFQRFEDREKLKRKQWIRSSILTFPSETTTCNISIVTACNADSHNQHSFQHKDFSSWASDLILSRSHQRAPVRSYFWGRENSKENSEDVRPLWHFLPRTQCAICPLSQPPKLTSSAVDIPIKNISKGALHERTT